MSNFIKFGAIRASRQYGEMYTSHSFYIFIGDFSGGCIEYPDYVDVKLPSLRYTYCLYFIRVYCRAACNNFVKIIVNKSPMCVS